MFSLGVARLAFATSASGRGHGIARLAAIAATAGAGEIGEGEARDSDATATMDTRFFDTVHTPSRVMDVAEHPDARK